MLLHLVVVEEALRGLLLVKAAVFHSSTVEVPARLSDVDDVLLDIQDTLFHHKNQFEHFCSVQADSEHRLAEVKG